MSYLDCCEQAYREYAHRVQGVDYRQTFQYLAFHTPFGGMIKGAHRAMMRKHAKAKPEEIDADFHRRVYPGLRYCQRVGNIMGATVFMSLASTIDFSEASDTARVGCFSYGSGCCSEFYSGLISAEGRARQRRFAIGQQLDQRYRLSLDDYERVIESSRLVRFGTRNVKLDYGFLPQALRSQRGPVLVLREIKEFHREYEWTT
jgi:polyketide biosynthesis 3-hydroxy-3-methylglutaryl-CoA synthase-like enzyme PksG